MSVSKNMLKLYEAVSPVFIECNYCTEKLTGEDVFECAEYADETGWKVNKAGKVKCPKCVKKMSKK